MAKLASTLINYRKKHSLTQLQLSKHIGISDMLISLYENGKRRPAGNSIKKLLKIFTIDEIIT